MSPVLVDSNVILDVATGDHRWGEWSSRALEVAANRAVLVINPLVYAEVSIGYERVEDLERALPRELFRREALPWEAAFLAGKCFLQYRKGRGVRSAPLPDFYIGAHAAIAGYALLTRDARRYRTYFPGIELISPRPRLRPDGREISLPSSVRVTLADAEAPRTIRNRRPGSPASVGQHKGRREP